MALRIVSTLLLAAGLLMAQGHNRNNNVSPIDDMGMARQEPIDQLAQILKLNRDQKKDVKEILDDTQKEITPLRENLTKSREQIGAAIESGKGQAEIDGAVKSYSDIEAQVSTVEAKAFSKIFSGLDADQKANAQALVNSLMFMHEVFKRKNWNTASAE
jgi:Spy/CpxP family protein refolding chaperone